MRISPSLPPEYVRLRGQRRCHAQYAPAIRRGAYACQAVRVREEFVELLRRHDRRPVVGHCSTRAGSDGQRASTGGGGGRSDDEDRNESARQRVESGRSFASPNVSIECLERGARVERQTRKVNIALRR